MAAQAAAHVAPRPGAADGGREGERGAFSGGYPPATKAGALKTEHSGAKHGNGAYWGPKRLAKRKSNKRRRRVDRAAARA